jgi:uncharacterized protein YdeI (YjbR/CyaY-like superfamily)
MNTMNTKVDFYFTKAKKWQQEFQSLRAIVLSCGLNEELKWGCPCYTFNENNIVLIHGFKEYCSLLFMKGALLNDASGILIQQTENVQAARQIRFTNIQEIAALEGTKTEEFAMPEEFKSKLDEMPAFKTAFEALSAGRQRAYKLYFSAPKQSKTRVARIEKSIQPILDGKGLDD